MASEEVHEKQSSIKVSVNAKNEAAFEAKLYFNEEERDKKDVISEITEIINELKLRFKR